MSFEWIQDDGMKVTAIVGICKNAGKTSLLNHLLRTHAGIRFGVFSTGIDGEELDSVFRTPKPSVELPPDTLFCCDSLSLDALGGKVEVLASLADIQRPLWIVRSLYQLSSMITGPASMNEQIALSQKLLQLGAEKVLVDGSLDRKSIVLSPSVDAVVLVIGASFGEPPEVERELRRLIMLASLPQYKSNPAELELLANSDEILIFDRQNWLPTGLQTLSGMEGELRILAGKNTFLSKLYLPGAVTSSSLGHLINLLQDRDSCLILRHPDCLKLSLPDLEKLASRTFLEALIPFRIKGFAINSEGVGIASTDAAHFRSHLRASFPQLDLTDIMELTHA